MKLVKYLSLVALFLTTGMTFAQDADAEERKPGHLNNNRFKQLYEEFSTPNMYRSPNGAPGPEYYQQQADYVMNLILDDKASKLYGTETITYTNNSPDELEYLWVQLDQNVRARDSKSPLIESSGASPAETAGSFVGTLIRREDLCGSAVSSDVGSVAFVCGFVVGSAVGSENLPAKHMEKQ